jgi:hypothetical protein
VVAARPAGPARVVDARAATHYEVAMASEARIRGAAAFALVLGMVGCGGTGTAPAVSGEDGAGGALTTATADPFAVDGSFEHEPLPEAAPSYAATMQKLPPLPEGVSPPPDSCKPFIHDKAGAAASCTDAASALSSLDAALTQTESEARDAALRGLEGCGHLPVGLATALRAELAPPECGDGIVAAKLGHADGIDGPVYDALFGLALAGRLARTATKAPELKPPYDKDTVKAYIDGPMGAWVREQAAAIQSIAELGAKLRYYGKAVVAVEAGMADMRFIVAARQVPVPDEIARFDEAKEKYYQNLELSLDARKKRGRDAALVGLGELAQVGVVRDPRVVRARELLSSMYGGAPIDALDPLRLPPLSPVEPSTPEQRVAARLPSFYAGLILDPAAASDEAMLRQLIEKGVPLPQRIALAKAQLSPQARDLYARARLEMVQNYWRRVDVEELVGLLSTESAAERSDGATLLLALGIALRGGPANAAEMMVKAPLAQLGFGDVRALDAMGSAGGPLAGMAAYDAALVHELAAPASAAPEYWDQVAERYRQAAAASPDVRDKDDANKRAEEAADTAAAIRARPK